MLQDKQKSKTAQNAHARSKCRSQCRSVLNAACNAAVFWLPRSLMPQCPEHSLAIPQCPEHSLAIPQCPEHSLAMPQCPEHSLAIPQCPEHSLAIPQCPEPIPVNRHLQDHQPAVDCAGSHPWLHSRTVWGWWDASYAYKPIPYVLLLPGTLRIGLVLARGFGLPQRCGGGHTVCAGPCISVKISHLRPLNKEQTLVCAFECVRGHPFRSTNPSCCTRVTRNTNPSCCTRVTRNTNPSSVAQEWPATQILPLLHKSDPQKSHYLTRESGLHWLTQAGGPQKGHAGLGFCARFCEEDNCCFWRDCSLLVRDHHVGDADMEATVRGHDVCTGGDLGSWQLEVPAQECGCIAFLHGSVCSIRGMICVARDTMPAQVGTWCLCRWIALLGQSMAQKRHNPCVCGTVAVRQSDGPLACACSELLLLHCTAKQSSPHGWPAVPLAASALPFGQTQGLLLTKQGIRRSQPALVAVWASVACYAKVVPVQAAAWARGACYAKGVPVQVAAWARGACYAKGLPVQVAAWARGACYAKGVPVQVAAWARGACYAKGVPAVQKGCLLCKRGACDARESTRPVMVAVRGKALRLWWWRAQALCSWLWLREHNPNVPLECWPERAKPSLRQLQASLISPNAYLPQKLPHLCVCGWW